jgi:hypothetical protein
VPEQVRLIGSARLISTLGRAGKDIADMRAGFEEAGKIAAQAAKSIAPRRSGALAGSITSESGGRNTATLTSPLIYAAPIHWGWPAHNIAENPFLMRGAEESETRWMGALEAEAQRICGRVEGA